MKKRISTLLIAIILIFGSIQTVFASEPSVVISSNIQISIGKEVANVYKQIEKNKQENPIHVDYHYVPLSIPILMFHHISEDANSSLTSDSFRRYMVELKEGGYETIFYKDLYSFVKGGRTLPEKPVIVTFDDGYESNYQYAYPILKGLGMKAEISIIGNSIGLDKNPNTGVSIIPHFSWDQAREMVNSGFVRIHSHSYGMHQHVSAEEVDRLGVIKNQYESPQYYYKMFTQDCLQMKKLIQKKLGYDDLIYTYPYGKYNLKTESVLKNLNYKMTVTTDSGVNQMKIGDVSSLKALKRIPCDINNSDNIIARIQYYKKHF